MTSQRDTANEIHHSYLPIVGGLRDRAAGTGSCPETSCGEGPADRNRPRDRNTSSRDAHDKTDLQASLAIQVLSGPREVTNQGDGNGD